MPGWTTKGPTGIYSNFWTCINRWTEPGLFNFAFKEDPLQVVIAQWLAWLLATGEVLVQILAMERIIISD